MSNFEKVNDALTLPQFYAVVDPDRVTRFLEPSQNFQI